MFRILIVLFVTLFNYGYSDGYVFALYSSNGVNLTFHANAGDHNYPNGKQEYFNSQIISHDQIEHLNVIGNQYDERPLDLSLLSHLKKLKSLNIEQSRVGISQDILTTIPAIPSLVHLGILKIFMTKETFDKIPDWISRNPQIESLDLSNTQYNEEIDDPLLPFTHLNKLNKIKLSSWVYFTKKPGGNVGVKKNIKLDSLYLFPSLKIVDYRSDHYYVPTNGEFSLLLNLPKIEELYLGNISTDSEALPHQKGRPLPLDFHYIPENNTSIKDEFNKLTTSHTLQKLYLENVQLESVDFSYLAPNLKLLSINRGRYQFADWRKLQTNQGLEELELSNIEFGPFHIEQINLVSLPNVKIFRSNIAKGINLPAFIPNVRELHLAGSNITGGDLKKIGQLHSLEVLDISDTSINGSSLTHLKGLTNLKRLSMNDLKLNTGDFKHLQKLTSLEELSLVETDLSLKQVDALGELSSLKLLDLSRVSLNISIVEIQALQKKLPHTHIIFDRL